MNKKIKVLIVGMTSGIGGVETFITNLLKNINYDQFDVELLTHQKINEKYMKIIDEKKIKVNYVKGIKEGFFSYIKQINCFYKNNKYDVIHLNECAASQFLYVFPIIFNKSTKLIIHSHNGDSQHPIVHKLLSFFQNKRADEKWTCSDVAGEWMYGAKEKNYILIHNGIELANYKYDKKIRKKVRKELKIEEDEKIIISVARFEEQKNHKRIIDIFKKYLSHNENSKLLLVGSGEKYDEIKKYCDDLNINNKVVFLGIRNDVNELLISSDLFLLPSLYEGLPFVCVEAQAASLPILASTTVSEQIAITDLVYFEKLGSSDEEWSLKIENILKNSIDKESSEWTKKLQKAGYDIIKVVGDIEKKYKE